MLDQSVKCNSAANNELRVRWLRVNVPSFNHHFQATILATLIIKGTDKSLCFVRCLFYGKKTGTFSENPSLGLCTYLRALERVFILAISERTIQKNCSEKLCAFYKDLCNLSNEHLRLLLLARLRNHRVSITQSDAKFDRSKISKIFSILRGKVKDHSIDID